MWVIYSCSWGRVLEGGILAWYVCCHFPLFPQEWGKESTCCYSIWVESAWFSVVCSPVEYHATKNSLSVLSCSVQPWIQKLSGCLQTYHGPWDVLSLQEQTWQNFWDPNRKVATWLGASQILAVLCITHSRSRSSLLASQSLAHWRKTCLGNTGMFYLPLRC